MEIEWKDISLSEIASYSQGLQVTVEKQLKEKSKGFSRFIRIVDFTNENEEPRYIRTPNKKYFVSEDDIVMIRYGSQTAGKVVRGLSGVLANNMFKVNLNVDFISKKYLFLCLSENKVYQYLRNAQASSTMPAINFGIMDSIEIRYPPLPYQKAIAHILDTLDAKIETNQKMNHTLEDIAKGLFKSWFIDFDPVKAKTEGRSTGLYDEISNLFPDSFIASDLGEIPDKWSIEEIGSICECVGGGTPSTKEPLFWENGTNFWATPKDLSDLEKPFLLETSKKITDLGIQKISSRVLPIGSVLISSRAPVGYVAVAEVPLSINQGFIAIKPSEILSKEYLLNWAQANVEKFKNRASGTTFAEISKQSFRPIKILLPDEIVMRAFSDFTKIIYKRIISSMKEIKNLVDMKNILLPRLISGEIRISDAEKMIEKGTN